MLRNNIYKIAHSFSYAWNGIVLTTKGELNFRFHIIMALLVVSSGFYHSINNMEWLIVIITIGLVLGAELFNTAIEKIIDLLSPNYNKLAGEVKDIAAGAVLLISISAFICGLIIFIPKIFF